jgi:hypothetical protein
MFRVPWPGSEGRYDNGEAAQCTPQRTAGGGGAAKETKGISCSGFNSNYYSTILTFCSFSDPAFSVSCRRRAQQSKFGW